MSNIYRAAEQNLIYKQLPHGADSTKPKKPVLKNLFYIGRWDNKMAPKRNISQIKLHSRAPVSHSRLSN